MNIEDVLKKKERIESRMEEMLEEFSREAGLPFSTIEMIAVENRANSTTRRSEDREYRYHIKLTMTL
jgi:hypothetical protein